MRETATQTVESTLARLRTTEPLIHAYVDVDDAGALATARALDATSGHDAGPLHGAPFAVKEVIAVAGLPAAAGSRALSGEPAAADAVVVRRLRAAGAVFVGTQVSHELTCGLDEPPTRNPWDLERYPGGSSAGAGASVAVGSARIALGTDAAGSVRIPAAMAGVVGLKPTAGRVSAEGVVRAASAPSIDHVGVVARTVADVASALAAIAGPDRGGPDGTGSAGLGETTAVSRAGAAGADEDGAALVGVRLGLLGPVTREALRAHATPEPDVLDAVAEACERLHALGAELVEIEAPGLAAAPQAVSTLFAAELATAHRELLARRPQAYHDRVRALLRDGLEIPRAQVAASLRVRDELRRELREAFVAGGLTALVTPTTPRAAMPLATFDPARELGMLTPYTCPFNLTGQPAVSVPCGVTREGLPVGLQLVGQAYADEGLLWLAAAYERATPWSECRPDLTR